MKENTINKSYRSRDGDNYAKNLIVLGKEIRPSATNKKREVPELEIQLAGEYPVWFKWHGWCEEDLSFQVPILMSDELFSQYQRLVARGEDTPEAVKELQKHKRIEVLPENFKVWAKENVKNIQDFREAPYFIKENFKNFKQFKLSINK